jgi:hypothetical protein
MRWNATITALAATSTWLCLVAAEAGPNAIRERCLKMAQDDTLPRDNEALLAHCRDNGADIDAVPPPPMPQARDPWAVSCPTGDKKPACRCDGGVMRCEFHACAYAHGHYVSGSEARVALAVSGALRDLKVPGLATTVPRFTGAHDPTAWDPRGTGLPQPWPVDASVQDCAALVLEHPVRWDAVRTMTDAARDDLLAALRGCYLREALAGHTALAVAHGASVTADGEGARTAAIVFEVGGACVHGLPATSRAPSQQETP